MYVQVHTTCMYLLCTVPLYMYEGTCEFMCTCMYDVCMTYILLTRHMFSSTSTSNT